ncbi:MAG: twin-arginine translocase subunit TatC [Alphaproteobacteria bacterium]|nr:twin-arginine translocase subunit TatC [Alphaproteobacteria bacterium]
MNAPVKIPPPKPDPASPDDDVEASRAPLMDHLVELRQRLTRILIALGVMFCAGWFIAQPALDFLLTPLGDAAIRHGRDIAEFETVTTAPLELLFVKLKLIFLIALAVTFPYIAWEIYGFVAPGLYKKERMAVLPFLFVMPLLFGAGTAIVYLYVLPAFMDLSFSQEFATDTAKVVYLPKVKEYYELAISLLTAFGLAFQLPIVLSLLSRADVVHASGLRKGRKYAVIVIFIVAAMMTPPDPFSVFALALPLILLYETGIWSAVLIERGRKKRDEEEASREAEEERREATGAKPA